MDVLTPPQFKILQFAWVAGEFSIEDLIKSPVGQGRKDATLRTTCDRIAEKGFMELIKQKGKPVRYRPTIDKQKYMIKLARALFSDAQQEDKEFFKWAIDQV